MISLWILAILVVFALGLGHRAAINLRLAKYQRDRLKTTCLAKAGINKAIAVLKKDIAPDSPTKDYDSLLETWATGEDNGNNIFKDIEIVKDSGEKFTLYIMDEESRININNASGDLLVALLTEKSGVEVGQDASKIAGLIRAWRGEDMGVPDIDTSNFKKSAFSAPEELLLVLNYFYKDNAENAKAVYFKLKDYITAYPAITDSKPLNINTASEGILRILANSVGADETCINSIIAQIKSRISDPNLGPFKNKDEISLKFSGVDLCSNFFEKMKESLSVNSDFFTITSQGKVDNITKNIIAIYDRSGEGKIVYWHEN